ncbi:MAG: flagellin [Deltaproteobacteria bacterium]|nr:flagellin [Deltaproteobacteria bacterium]
MGLRIQNNIAAMNAHRNLMVADAGMSKSLERLSSGYRINSAKDDAAGLAISQGFRANIASTKVAQRNVSEANALLQTAEGAMNTVGDVLTRMKELATQAASANAGSDIGKISAEYDTLVLEIDRIANSTEYAGTKLVDGNFSSGNTMNDGSSTWDSAANVYDINVSNAAAGAYTVAYSAGGDILTITKGGVSEDKTLVDGAQTYNFGTFGISFKTTGVAVADTIGAAMAGTPGLTVDLGANAKDFQVGSKDNIYNRVSVSIDSIESTVLGVSAGDVSSATNAKSALTAIDSAISALATSRGEIGSYQNRLSYASANLSSTIENFTAAESVIRDVDMAAEMTSFTKNQILLQSGTAMLAQANMAPQQVLSLFG